MNRIVRVALYILLGVAVIILLGVVLFYSFYAINSAGNMAELGPEAPALTERGLTFRDLNKNGKLDHYEDSRQPIDKRVEDLLSQMTLEEKAGLMFITMIFMNGDGSLMERPVLSNPLSFMFKINSEMVTQLKMTHFNTMQDLPVDVMARWNNNIQKLAERARLGIPVTLASDPRHAATDNPGANVATVSFSRWPTPLGLAATRDTALVREFADIARQEYLSVGIRLALHPMADLATEPRWGRINGTFGEDAALSAAMTKAYILGFQGDSLGRHSVACMTKHFAGGGPQKDGEDAHFLYGKEQVYPGGNFDYHLIPFEGAFAAGTAQIMPYYGIPVGQTSEDVGFAFNRDIITGLLRQRYQFDGVVCTDWNIISDGSFGHGRSWGVEQLTELERVKKVLDAGCDQFGGEASPDWIVELVESGQITEDRIDMSVRRLLEDKFQLGLFDNPYVDEATASQIVPQAESVRRGKEAQSRSAVLLKNDNNVLPLKDGIKLYVQHINQEVAAGYAEIVQTAESADYILVRLKTPYEERNEYFLEQFFHQGRLYFTEEEIQPILELARIKPTIIGITLERPALIPEILEASSALAIDFEMEDDVFMDIIFGRSAPQGKLPFELPSSLSAVENQLEDVPYDSKKPLFPFGFGLHYE
ncbi:MAG: beta-glucosidase [Candidatus Marinimicrobia bacterium]|nr:beta-glucosidase [Candidatus Neomarinimicrobiota bacterium]